MNTELPESLMLTGVTLKALQAESLRAHLKHASNGGWSLLTTGMPDSLRLAALVEECGEVARAMTRDGNRGKDHLVKELLQTANVAASWAQWLDSQSEDAEWERDLWKATE